MTWAAKLRQPTLFKLTALAFAVSVNWPIEPITLVEEKVLGLGTLLLANWKTRKAPTDAIEGEARR